MRKGCTSLCNGAGKNTLLLKSFFESEDKTMAKYKKTALLPWLSAKPDGKDRRFIQVGNSLLLSKRFQSLSAGARWLYLSMAMESGGRREFIFPLSSAKKYGISSTCLRRQIAELKASGLLQVDCMRCIREPNVYRFYLATQDNHGNM